MSLLPKNTIFVEYEGRKMSLTKLAKAVGISPATIWWRWNHGFRGELLWTKRKFRARSTELQHARRPKPVDVAILSQFARLPVVRVE